MLRLTCAAAAVASATARGDWSVSSFSEQRQPPTPTPTPSWRQTRKRQPAPIPCRDGTMVIPYVAPSREEQLQRLRSPPAGEEVLDVLVVGGGATGCGVALDAATKGMRVALVEREDFSAGTSSRSTKLIHGGIRYLEQAFWEMDPGKIKLVYEALEEREFMLQAAPYMNHALPIMIPLYKLWQIPYMYAGAVLYDLMSGRNSSLPRSQFITRQEALYRFPTLKPEGLKGAIVYYDGSFNDSRMALHVALTAAQKGAIVANHVEVARLLKDANGIVCGARVRDTLSGEEWDVRARVVVNATGSFCDVLRKEDNPATEDLVVPAGGVHVVLEDHFSPSDTGLIIPKTKDGRVLFFLPWENMTLSGTTDSETDITMAPRPTAEDVRFILQECNHYLDTRVRPQDVRAAWAGIRPLVRDPDAMRKGLKGTAAMSRTHVIEVSDNKLVTITGGKWTTFRLMAEETMDRVLKEFPHFEDEAHVNVDASTKKASVMGADRAGVVCDHKFDRIAVTLRANYNIPKSVALNLVRNYGTRALQVAELATHHLKEHEAPALLHPRYDFLEAEVEYAVTYDYACTAVDVLARRLRFAFMDADAAHSVGPRVVQLMQSLLGWNKQRCAQELQQLSEFVTTMRSPDLTAPPPLIPLASSDKRASAS